MRVCLMHMVTAALLCGASYAPGAPRAVSSPRIAIVLSRESVTLDSYIPQRTGYGWMGVAALSGVPYTTLFLDELVNDGPALAKEYSALVLPELHALSDANYERLTRTVRAYREAGGAVVLDGPPGIWNEDGAWRGEGALHEALDCTLGGFVGDNRHHVAIANGAGGAHSITRGWADGESVTPPFAIGFNALIPREGVGDVLLEARSVEDSFPWLSCVNDGRSRVVLIGGVFGAGDVASLFRNGAVRFPEPPNRVYDILVAALQWAVYGDDRGPIPALQFCAADAAVLIRLDGDHSNRPEDVAFAFSCLTEIAGESGVATAYGIVSGRAEETGWPLIAPLAKRLEENGGEIGTHTHTHGIEGALDKEIARRELDQSVLSIEHGLTLAGYDPDGIPFLINPNGMIPMTAYDEIASRFSLYFTHGISSSVPVAYGVSSWFGQSEPPFTVIYDSPEPDFQWLYDRDWSYTAEEAATIEGALFDHYLRSIGRGVLFDMMWHDYGLATSGYDQSRPDFKWADLLRPARKKSESNEPLFETLRKRFAEAHIYCPEPLETANKLRILQGTEYSWSWSDTTLSLTLDLSGFDAACARSTAGMGIRIDRYEAPIRSVTIDGEEHAAFRAAGDRSGANVVILPALAPGQHEIEIHLGLKSEARGPRLTYVSKSLVSISRDAASRDLAFTIDCEGLVRFEIEAHEGGLYLSGADWFQVDAISGPGRFVLAGHNSGGGTFVAKTAPPGFPRLHSAEGPVLACERDENGEFAVEIGVRDKSNIVLRFSCDETVTLTNPDGEDFVPVREGEAMQTVTIPGIVHATRFTLTVGGAS